MPLARNLILILSSSFVISSQQFACAQDSGSSSQSSPSEKQSEQEFLQNTDEKWRKMIGDGQNMLTAGKNTAAISMLRRSVSQVDRLKIEDERQKDRMRAIANKKLAQAYTANGDYVKADIALKDSKTTFETLGIADGEMDQARANLESHYKTIDFPALGDQVTGYLKEAGVNKIAVFRQEDRDLVQIDLTQKYVKPVESKDVPKVSFEFFSKPNGDYQISKIQGLQVFAKSLWVNLLDSILKVGSAGAARSAEITAGKMGMTKTVVVDVPDDIYNTTKKILDNLIGAIKGQPAMAAPSQPDISKPQANEVTPGDSPVNNPQPEAGYGNVPPQADSPDSPLDLAPGQRLDRNASPPSPDPQTYGN